MKKTVVASLLAVSSMLAWDDAAAYLREYDPTIDGQVVLGDVTGRNGDIIGTLKCEGDEYVGNFYTVNYNTNYEGAIRKVFVRANSKEVCAAMSAGTSEIKIDPVAKIKGAYYVIGSEEYNDGEKDCMLMRAWIKPAAGGSAEPFIFRSCYGTNVMNISEKHPEFPKWDSTDSGVYKLSRDVIKSTSEWNKAKYTKYSGLWEDQNELRPRYSASDILKHTSKATYLGDYLDANGYHMFSVKMAGGKPFLVADSTDYNYKVETKELAKNIEDYNKYGFKADSKFVYKCRDSLPDDKGKIDRIGYMVLENAGKDIYWFAMVNPVTKSDNIMTCDVDNIGKEYDPVYATNLIGYSNVVLKPAISKPINYRNK